MLSRLRELSNTFFEKFSFLGKFFSPNEITIFGIILAILGSIFLIQKNFFLSAFFFLLSGFFDLLDGIIARKFKKVTGFGGVLDAVVDRYEEFLFAFSSFLSGFVEGWLALVAFLSMVMPSYTRARAESTGKMKTCNVGVLERQEKLLLFITALILQNFFKEALFFCFIIIAILGQITVLQRLFAVKKEESKRRIKNKTKNKEKRKI
ncbi:MAG: CDP-alcohol phosphatidyltransferase family protein [Candidatus Micrarchaeia archaeon]